MINIYILYLLAFGNLWSAIVNTNIFMQAISVTLFLVVLHYIMIEVSK